VTDEVMGSLSVKLLEAKRELYRLLLAKKESELTDIEVDTLYALSQDQQIQELLEKVRDHGKDSG